MFEFRFVDSERPPADLRHGLSPAAARGDGGQAGVDRLVTGLAFEPHDGDLLLDDDPHWAEHEEWVKGQRAEFGIDEEFRQLPSRTLPEREIDAEVVG